jgi:hypothetical protein
MAAEGGDILFTRRHSLTRHPVRSRIGIIGQIENLRTADSTPSVEITYCAPRAFWVEMPGTGEVILVAPPEATASQLTAVATASRYAIGSSLGRRLDH